MINNRLTILVGTETAGRHRPEACGRSEGKSRTASSEAEHAGILHVQSIPRPCDDQTKCDEQKNIV